MGVSLERYTVTVVLPLGKWPQWQTDMIFRRRGISEDYLSGLPDNIFSTITDSPTHQKSDFIDSS